MSCLAPRHDEPRNSIDPMARRTRWIPLLVFTIALLIFAPICRHAFVSWDDDYTIESNVNMQHPSMETVLHYWRHAFMDLYVPVTYTLWTGIAFLSKRFGAADSLDPRFFHAASILIHGLNALLVYGLLRRLLKTQWPSAVGALLFALHPVQVETVAWASGFKDLLCAMFSLIAVNEYVSATSGHLRIRQECPPHRWLHNGIGLIAMLLAMLSKPTAMVIPLLLITIDRLVVGRGWRRILTSTAPYFLLAVPCIVWTKLCQPASFLRHVPIWQRPLVAADALAFYLYKMVLPIRLAYDYGRSPWAILESRLIWFTWMVPAILAIALVLFRRSARTLIAAYLILVIGVLPVLGLTTFDFEMISTVSDHYLYLAMLGPALAAAWSLSRLYSTREKPYPNPNSSDWDSSLERDIGATRWPVFASVLVLALFAARSTDQMRYWQDSRTFFTRTIELNPKSWSAWYGLAFLNHMDGRELAARANADSKRGFDSSGERNLANESLRDAMECYRHAVELNEFDVAAHHGYGAMLMYFGNYDDAGRQFVQVLRLRNSLIPSMRSNYYADTDLLGQCLFFSGHTKAAAAVFKEAAALQPAPPDAALHLRAAQAVLARRNAAHQALSGDGKEAAESATGAN